MTDWLRGVRQDVCARLRIDDFHFVEIEAKKRVLPEQVKGLRKFLLKRRRVREEGSKSFFDQFLDTPRMDLFKRGASLRLRYKRNGSKVYLQYKGPGFLENGLLFRSEFSTERLRHLLREESHHDIIHFTRSSVPSIVARHAPSAMAQAMRRHLGAAVVSRITAGPIICLYQKTKFTVNLGSAFLEPSIDRVFAFQINKHGLHPLSTFCEYENEIKSPTQSLTAKIDHIPELLDFDEKVVREFGLPAERLDKYHRCSSIFLKHS
jgi:hypothetical protein